MPSLEQWINDPGYTDGFLVGVLYYQNYRVSQFNLHLWPHVQVMLGSVVCNVLPTCCELEVPLLLWMSPLTSAPALKTYHNKTYITEYMKYNVLHVNTNKAHGIPKENAILSHNKNCRGYISKSCAQPWTRALQLRLQWDKTDTWLHMVDLAANYDKQDKDIRSASCDFLRQWTKTPHASPGIFTKKS